MESKWIDEDWQILKNLLGGDWEHKARECGALRRARGVRDAETLLRLIFLHVATGLSLRQTAMRAEIAGLARISDVALLKRLRASESWLGELTRGMWGSTFLDQLQTRRRLLAIDATYIREPGKTGSEWHLHYSLELPKLNCDFFEVSERSESFTRFPMKAGDIVLADRGYCRGEGLAYVVSKKADLVVRWHSNALRMVDQKKRAFSLLPKLRALSQHRVGEWSIQIEHQSRFLEARICALRKSAAAAEQSRKKALRQASKQGSQIHPQTLEFAEYVIILTTLTPRELKAAEVLQLYRSRWQVELLFKRLKSLLALGHLPKYDPRSSRAWLQAKLLVALLIERLVQQAKTVSPWGFELSWTNQ